MLPFTLLSFPGHYKTLRLLSRAVCGGNKAMKRFTFYLIIRKRKGSGRKGPNLEAWAQGVTSASLLKGKLLKCSVSFGSSEELTFLLHSRESPPGVTHFWFFCSAPLRELSAEEPAPHCWKIFTKNIFCFLRQGSLCNGPSCPGTRSCRPGWPCTQRTDCLCLGLKACATTSGQPKIF